MKRRVARAYAWTRNKPGKWRVAPREGCTRNYGCHNRWRRLEEGMEVTMPAVTAETLTLPRLPHPGPELVDRPVVSVTTAPSGLEGEGFPVRRAFAGVDLGILDPFVHMDQMGEVDYGPGEPKGTPWHPHRGVRDRHLHDRRHPAAPGLQRRRRPHHRRRYAVDDRGFRSDSH